MPKDKGIAAVPLLVIVVGLGVLILMGGVLWFFLQTTTSPTKPSTSGITFKKVSQDKLLFTGGYADPTFARLSDGTLVLYVNKFGSGVLPGYYAYTSLDGLNWKEKSATLPQQAATGRAFVTDRGVRFYYPGLGPLKPTDPPASIFSSFAQDGFNFTKEEGTRISPQDGYYLEGPTLIKIADGKYRMYFDEDTISSGMNKVGKIWGATSTDGLKFTRDEKPTIESDPSVEQMPSGYYLPDDTLRLYYGNFSPQTSGVVYTVDIQEQK